MNKSNLQLTVIIPTLGETRYLLALLESLKNQKVDFNFEVLLVDNSLNAETNLKLVKLALESKLNIKVIRTSKKGVNFARNLGIEVSQASVLLFIDDDCWMNDRLLLAKHVYFHTEFQDYFAIGGIYTLHETSGFFDRYYQLIQMLWLYNGLIRNNGSNSKQTRYLIGGHFSAKKNMLDQFNIRFDEQIIYGGSELSLFLQARKLKQLLRLENISLIHRPELSFFILIKKLYKQGQGKAYLNENIQDEYDGNYFVKNDLSLFQILVIGFFNIFFWLGYYQKQGKMLNIFAHFFKKTVGYFKYKRYSVLANIRQKEEEKKSRGDRL
ncbi:MAG: glycosyltransferase family 2 protein [Pseudobdellovibrio sp.]